MPEGKSPVIVMLEQTCGACPSQWEGQLADGRALYVRYRHGYLRACVADTLGGAISFGSADLMAQVAVVLSEEGRVISNDDELAEQVQQRSQTIRAAVPGGEMLYHEDLSVERDDDGFMETAEMLAYLQSMGVSSSLASEGQELL